MRIGDVLGGEFYGCRGVEKGEENEKQIADAEGVGFSPSPGIARSDWWCGGGTNCRSRGRRSNVDMRDLWCGGT